MAHWSEAAVTQAGIDRLNEMMAVRKLQITTAAGGSGRVGFTDLGTQTALLNQRQNFHLVDEQDGPQGKTVTVQITNREVSEEYLLEQIGVFGKLDGEVEDVLLFVLQDEHGVKVPAASEESFLLEINCLLKIDSKGRLQVVVDPAGLVTINKLKEALGDIEPTSGEGAPTVSTASKVGQKYIDTSNGKIYTCTAETMENDTVEYTWVEGELGSLEEIRAAVAKKTTADEVFLDEIPVSEALGSIESISGEGAPTESTDGIIGQKYTDESTGDVYTCVAVSAGEDGESCYVWVSGNLGTVAEIRAALHNVSAALSNKAELSQISNPNLLDNWYFADPINQRGQSTYTSNNATYCIDRWILEGVNSIQLKSAGLTITCDNAGEYDRGILQKLDIGNIPGQLTLSVFVVEGEGALFLSNNSQIIHWNGPGVYSVTVDDLNCSTDFFHIRVKRGGSSTILAAKLELGPIQTLAHQDPAGNWVLNDPPPNPVVELKKCQKYFIRMDLDTGAQAYGTGIAYQPTWGYVLIPIPTTMRALPAINYKNMQVACPPATNNGKITDITPVCMTSSVIQLDVRTEDMDTGKPFFLYGGSLYFDANL